MSEQQTGSDTTPQALEERGDNRSHRPSGQAFRDFMASNWGERIPLGLEESSAKDYLPARHQAVGRAFKGDRLVIPAGSLKVRSNDTDYRFRAHSAFAHLTGLGGELEPDAVLVLHPLWVEGKVNDEEVADLPTHEPVLYFTPRASRTSEEFYADSRYGEFWVGARPSLEEMEAITGIKTANINTLRDALAKDVGPGGDSVQLRLASQEDAVTTQLVQELRSSAGADPSKSAAGDAELTEMLSEMRLTKDEYEIAQMQAAVDATKDGFESIIRSLPRAIDHPRGERVIDGAFLAVAREQGNGVGYETIAAGGNNANTLHWIDNSAALTDGSLVLVDAGVELDSLYTADITRTLPVNGKFTEIQARIYQAVLDAAEAALARAAEPGARFRNVHEAAQEVLAARLEEWGILPVSAEESLKPTGQQHRRWMPHGTSHHLGIDVHDCAQARKDLYQEAQLKPGMIFTIEPGLYFRADDLAVPEEYRGIGVRIEDDIVILPDGTPHRLSESIPRTVDGVEKWIRDVQAAAKSS